MKKFSSPLLQATLTALTSKRSFVVAYSGGVDSHVLLHAMAQWRTDEPQVQLRAIHVNHALSAMDDQWQIHCVAVCQALQIPLTTHTLTIPRHAQRSTEAIGRQLRYRALKELMQDGECVLTAHHQDDQVETFLLQALRGSGLLGLRSIASTQVFGRGALLRPLLNFTRAALLAYAQQHHLNWIEDDTNYLTTFRRNFLRQKIIPLLKTQWPSLTTTVSRTVTHCQQAHDLLAIGSQELVTVLRHPLRDTLQLSALTRLTVEQQSAVIRQWMMNKGVTMPSQIKLNHILSDVVHARRDAMPCVCWGEYIAQRYRDELYIERRLPEHDAHTEFYWHNLAHPLVLPAQLGVLTARRQYGAGIRLHASDTVSVKFRVGGEKIQLQGHAFTHCLKKLLQTWGIPPWWRNRIPLIAVNGIIAQIGNTKKNAAFAVTDPQEDGWVISIHSDESPWQDIYRL